jgi:hypothetical protein
MRQQRWWKHVMVTGDEQHEVCHVRVACVLPVIATLLAVAGLVRAATPVTALLATQIRVQERVLEMHLEELRRQQADMEEAWSRVQRLSSDLLRAEINGESAEDFRYRSEDLAQAEAELLSQVQKGQRLRSSISQAQALLEGMRTELEETEEIERTSDPLTGRWQVNVEPGGLEGIWDLRLEGTLVSGIYRLSGGWFGSLRGTLVGNKVRLERIDSELGFSAIFYGRLLRSESPMRLQGTWEGTNLAAGLPTGGTWVGELLEDPTEAEIPR